MKEKEKEGAREGGGERKKEWTYSDFKVTVHLSPFFIVATEMSHPRMTCPYRRLKKREEGEKDKMNQERERKKVRSEGEDGKRERGKGIQKENKEKKKTGKGRNGRGEGRT